MIGRALVVLVLAGGLHASTAPDWVRAAMQDAIPALPPRTTAVVLLDRTVVTIGDDVHLIHQRVVRVLAPAGRRYAYGGAVFDDRTKLLALRGWSIDRDGKVRALRERDAVETTAASFEVFTDAKQKILDLPAEVGSVVAFESETRWRPYEPSLVWRFQETIPVLRARLELRRPAEWWTYEAKWMNYTPVEPSAGPVWELRNIPAIADEPRMPADSAVAGRLGLLWSGGQRTWNHIATWFHGLAVSRLASTPPLQTKTRELVANAADPIRAIARFAQRDVRYVAVEIGIGGYQPHAANDVLANRFGDCKDKATLLSAMLAEIGMASHYVLVHTTRGVVEPSFPSIHAFNHVISAIRIPRERAKEFDAVIDHPRLGTLLLFDPTGSTTHFGQLPPYLQAGRALLVTPEGGDLIDLPVHAPAASGLRRTAKFQLDEQGALRGSVEERRTGAMAAEMRDRLQQLNATERVHVVNSALAHHLANHTASDVTIENLDDPDADLVIRYTLAAPAYATYVAGMLLVRPRVLGAKGEEVVDASERKHPYVTDGPSMQTDDIEIALPPSFALDELPKPVTLSTPHVEYTSASRFENGVLQYTRTYTMKTHTIDRDGIPALNAAFAKIAADERASAVFR